MKKLKVRIATILMMAMLITSFEFAGAFAEEPATFKTDALSSLNRVWLEWKPVPDATGYKLGTTTIKPTTVGDVLRYPVSASGGVAQTYTLTAVKGDETIATSTVTSKGAVRPIKYKLKNKKAVTLKSHGGKKQSTRIKKGEWIEAHRYGGGGKYIFDRNGSTFYIKRTRIGKKRADYTKKFNYSRKEAELFVNEKGLTSRTRYLFWVNTYTQHIYMFEGSKGNWKCIRDDECSTGKPASPTPTGLSGQKAVHKKIKSRHGIKYWLAFSDINSIHGKKKAWKLGKPASNGCVRNYPANAKYFYKAGKGTRVYIY